MEPTCPPLPLPLPNPLTCSSVKANLLRLLPGLEDRLVHRLLPLGFQASGHVFGCFLDGLVNFLLKLINDCEDNVSFPLIKGEGWTRKVSPKPPQMDKNQCPRCVQAFTVKNITNGEETSSCSHSTSNEVDLPPQKSTRGRRKTLLRPTCSYSSMWSQTA